MAVPRRVSTRRAVLSYSQIKEMNPEWADLMVKDYQGILQDFAFTADEIDTLEVNTVDLQDSHYPSLSSQMQQIQKQLDGLPEFTIDTSGFTTDSTLITTDKVIA